MNVLCLEKTTLKSEELNDLISASHGDPFSILGPHRLGDGYVIRVFHPFAESINLIETGEHNAEQWFSKTHESGLFELILLAAKSLRAICWKSRSPGGIP